MRKISAALAAVLVLALLLSAAGCGKKAEPSMVGTWEYTDAENDIGAVYVLKDDGTGTYTMNVAGTEVVYELRYEVKDGHLLVSYVNNEIFSEDDVFDSEISFENDNTVTLTDTAGGDAVTFVRK